MASTRPAELIGIHGHTLNAGSPANLVLFDLPTAAAPDRLAVRATINCGLAVYGSI
jgi:dihydroorotase-like cyclic amidohydrolase